MGNSDMPLRHRRALSAALLLVGILLLGRPAPVALADTCEDGWPSVPDPLNDAGSRGDIVRVCWLVGANGLSFGIDRGPQPSNASPVVYTIQVDTNNNGSYGDSDDRVLTIRYQPKNGSSTVSLTVATPSGTTIASRSGDWGDNWAAGSIHVEVSVTFAELSISGNRTIQFAAASDDGDNVAAVQVANVPVSGLGWALPALGALLVIGWQLLAGRARRAGGAP